MTIEIGLTLALVGLTFFLFIKEIWSSDINALIILIVLGLTSQIPGLTPLVTSNQLFSGFSSNAVIAIIALMIMAYGIQNTGAMDQVGRLIARRSRGSETIAIALLCSIAGLTSGFMQNIGAVALFIPVASYLSFQTSIPLSRLLLPMGFCVILGGNLSLLGNGSLIILNDLLPASSVLIEQKPLELFSVFPIGIVLLLFGVLFFALVPSSFLDKLLATHKEQRSPDLATRYELRQGSFIIAEDNPFAGATVRNFEEHFDVQVIALKSTSRRETLAPYRSSIIESGSTLAIIGQDSKFEQMEQQLKISPDPTNLHFSEIIQEQRAGLSEIVLTSRARLIGSSLHESFFRKQFDATPLLINRQDALISGKRVNEVKLNAGDLLMIHSPGSSIDRIKEKKEIICANTECTFSTPDTSHGWHALIVTCTSLLLTIFTAWPLGLCLWLGVLGMFILKIVSPNEAYSAVSWKTVVMLASLIPLGTAMESSGTAEWLSQFILAGLPNNPVMIQICIALLTTILTLVMSNVGATIILVPIAISIAEASGLNITMMVLLVGLSASNSFLIPTHQANAIILSAGRYKVSGFVKSGGIITLAYIAIEIMMLNLIY